jgi:hypothetical protein
MTDPTCCGNGDGCNLLNDGLDEVAQALVAGAFAALWHDVTPRPDDLGSSEVAEDVFRKLAAMGRCQLDQDRIVGAHGLTMLPTPHQIRVPAGTRHTWCGFDAVGIPAALGLDATAVTSCTYCGRTIAVELARGEPLAGSSAVVWMPASAGEHLIDDFCSRSNLFCNAEHLAGWRGIDDSGNAISLDEAASLGRHTWADVADVEGIWKELAR